MNEDQKPVSNNVNILLIVSRFKHIALLDNVEFQLKLQFPIASNTICDINNKNDQILTPILKSTISDLNF